MVQQWFNNCSTIVQRLFNDGSTVVQKLMSPRGCKNLLHCLQATPTGFNLFPSCYVTNWGCGWHLEVESMVVERWSNDSSTIVQR